MVILRASVMESEKHDLGPRARMRYRNPRFIENFQRIREMGFGEYAGLRTESVSVVRETECMEEHHKRENAKFSLHRVRVPREIISP